jgi:hypothetical protein
MTEVLAASAPGQLPRLHVLKLHEDPVQDESYERFDLQWVLDDSSNQDAIISPGDVLLIPDLLTGAGEFEGMRFVGQREPPSNHLRLLSGGVESPEFPPDIIPMHSGRNLRDVYGKLLDALLLKSDGGIESLEDVMGGPEEVDEYWNEPPQLGEKKKDGQWVIPLKNCTRIETIDFSGDTS